MAVTNTGIVLRTIIGVHDANFVHPIGDELVLNGGFENDSTGWLNSNINGFSISNGKLNLLDVAYAKSNFQPNVTTVGKTYKVTFEVSNYVKGQVRFFLGGSVTPAQSSNGVFTFYVTASANTAIGVQTFDGGGTTLSIDNISVKEVLVNRESTATNTGIVERSLTGVNESDLWLDSESTSVVNNTGIVERPITGVNESDPMFPDNTISNIRNINDTTLYEELLEALQLRAAYYENEEGTTEILTNLFNC